MKGDFTRDSFDPLKDFTRVLFQQGRVQIDADWNEQVSIFWQFVRTLTRDLIGPYAGPESNCGFGIVAAGDQGVGSEEQLLQKSIRESGDFLIGPGNYYVDGILVKNENYLHFSKQTHYHPSMLLKDNNSPHLIYLDVWEREILAAEDESIREVALNGVDTAARARVVWQVKSAELGGDATDCQSVQNGWHEFMEDQQPRHRGRLRARAHTAIDSGFVDPSTVAPTSRYRGLQNQLYRVEIHHPGAVGQTDPPTFKWSRENGSVVFAIVSMADSVLTLSNLGRDPRSGLKVGDWVEIVDDDHVKSHKTTPLHQVEKVGPGPNQVTLTGPAALSTHRDKHALLRRWDHKQGDPRKGGLELREGAAVIKEGDGDRFWLSLENGVQIQFKTAGPPNKYRTGDYWLIPARIATGNVEWPQRGGEPDDLPPTGIEHHYGPLAIVAFTRSQLVNLGDCRPKFKIPKGY
jgi:Family of unknown function (DUF6519)